MSFWQVVKRFFEPVKNEPIKAFLCAIIPSVYAIFFTLWSKFIWNIWNSLEKWNFNDFNLWILLLLILTLISSTVYIIHPFVRLPWINNMKYFLYSKFLKKYITLDNTSIEKLWTWKINNILQKWIDSRLEVCKLIFWAFVRLLVGTVISLLLIYQTLWIYICLITLIFISLLALLSQFGNKYLIIVRKKIRDVITTVDWTLVKIIMSKFEVFQNKKITAELNKIRFNFNNWNDLIFEQSKKTILVSQLPRIWIDILRVIMFFYLWYEVLKSNITISDFFLYQMLLYIIRDNVSEVSELVYDTNQHAIYIQNLWNFIDNTKSTNIDLWSDFTYKSWNIKIQNMSFWYDKSSVFQNFSLQIQGWTKTAFVGESWGGKTTLIKLLAWYIRPDEWEIEIDKQKLSEIKLTDYYKHIGYLTQDPSVFDGTIYENLVYALDTEPPKEDLEKVVKLAKCEFIREFEKWLETEIGERWVRLSWWQKQRLAIAKIMLKNPNIILLDEPTSALDSFNEEQISIALHNLFKGKTVIVVAHRLQTVKQADRILLFEQWKILEEWTHDELVKLWWKYKKMLDLQSGF